VTDAAQPELRIANECDDMSANLPGLAEVSLGRRSYRCAGRNIPAAMTATAIHAAA
jgi:hypothetical protein